MRAKQTKVMLSAGDVTREFEFSHAERLLKMPKSGWRLPETSKYEFVGNALIVRRYKKGNNEE